MLSCDENVVIVAPKSSKPHLHFALWTMGYTLTLGIAMLFGYSVGGMLLMLALGLSSWIPISKNPKRSIADS